MHSSIKKIWAQVFIVQLLVLFALGCGGTSSNSELSSGPTNSSNSLDYGRIQGTVIATGGSVISGAVIETYQTQAVTATDGRYLLGPIPAGDYRVITRASGYAPSVKESVRVYPGLITENTNFTLSTEAVIYSPDFAVISLVPNVGTDGDLVAVYCKGCGGTPGTVTFNGKTATILDWNSNLDDKILVQVPTEVESGPVKVIIDGVSSHETQQLTFVGKPTILSATPSVAKGGAKITLGGRNFNLISNFNKVKLNDVACTVLSVASDKSMQIQIPQSARTGKLSIRIESNEYQLDGLTSNITLTIQPEIVYLTPRRSIPGVPLTVYGYNFGTDKNAVKVSFNGKVLLPTDLLTFSDTKLSFTVPDGTVLAPDATGEVKVQVNDSVSNALKYTAYNTIK